MNEILLKKSPNFYLFFFSSRRRHTRLQGDWSSDVCSSDLERRRDGVKRHRVGFELRERVIGRVVARPLAQIPPLCEQQFGESRDCAGSERQVEGRREQQRAPVRLYRQLEASAKRPPRGVRR